MVRTGCAWRYLPVDFPPRQTVYSHFQRWNRRGVTDRTLTELREQVRLAQDRAAEPTAGIIDSQSVRAADTVHSDIHGYDSGKKVNGRKRLTESGGWPSRMRCRRRVKPTRRGWQVPEMPGQLPARPVRARPSETEGLTRQGVRSANRLNGHGHGSHPLDDLA
ncbi:transposase [Micromonospora sp. NPDC049081]|uniref:transposase n=1 Tax=Micromonospora sp. NPDC049081 TaxID=3155150 RepID=UPI00340DEE9D